MTLRPHQSHSSNPSASALDYEIAQERAAALGRLGRTLEATLAALSAHDQADAAPTPSAAAVHERLVQAASDALWRFVIQREVCGMRDQRSIVRDYGVPREVQNRMGASGSGNRRPSA